MSQALSPFIVIEALDAGGSQTQTDLLAKRLKREKYTVVQLHFPQEDRATGRLIYNKFLLSNNKSHLSRREQALIYLQDFYSRAEDICIARRRQRSIVVSDRFCTSTFVYQTLGLSGAQRRRMMTWLLWLAYGDTPTLPQPTLVVFLDTPVEVSLRRLKEKKRDYFETRAKLTAIRNSYLKLASEHGWSTIPSVDEQGRERTREDVHNEVWQAVFPLLSQGVV